MTVIEDILSVESDSTASHWLRRRNAAGLKIEKTALQLFLRHGPEAVSIDDIAAAAGISRRTFFRYFRTRDDILIAQPARQMLASSQAVCRRPADESLLEALLETTREFSAADDETVHLSQQVMLRFPAVWQQSVGDLRRHMAELYEEMVKCRLRMDGRDDTDAGVIAAGLAAIVIHSYTKWVSDGCSGNYADALERGLQSFFGLAQKLSSSARH